MAEFADPQALRIPRPDYEVLIQEPARDERMHAAPPWARPQIEWLRLRFGVFPRPMPVQSGRCLGLVLAEHRRIAQTAAAEGLSVTRVHTGTTTGGVARARDTIRQRSDGPLRDAAVPASRGDDTARVEVTGVAASVLPFLRLRVHAETTGPVERFIPDITER
jgi:hypothetical protein